MMSGMDVRDATEADESALLELVNLGQPEPMTLEGYRRHRGALPPDYLVARRIGEEGGEPVAYLAVERHPLEPADWLGVTVKVAPSHRGRGLGRRLWDEAVDVVASRPATVMLTAGVRDDDPDSRSWAERRGYRLWAHRFQSVLDLERFDDARFAGAVAAASPGIRFTTLAELGPGRHDDFYELATTLERTVPDNDQCVVLERDAFDRFFLNPDVHPPEGTIVAVDEADDRLVAFTSLMRRAPGFMYTSMTGVLPSHRRRGIALAIKVRSVDVARSMGATRMGTNNLSINAPILAVNRALGYEPQPGIWMLRKPL